MPKLKVMQEHEKCIGCGSCVAVCPEFWEIDDDGKAKPRKGVKEDDNYEFEIDAAKGSCNKEAAEICPVQCIKVKKL